MIGLGGKLTIETPQVEQCLVTKHCTKHDGHKLNYMAMYGHQEFKKYSTVHT